MHLINVATREIEQYVGSKVPIYAILSHTWEKEEASFDDWRRPLTRLRKRRQHGFSKVLATCRQARRDGIPYVWVDTVCINKSSSTELSEAINSMFVWYKQAKVCYVYLADVPDQSVDRTDPLDLLRRSRWFTRGWTLQELLAPAQLVFYSRNWTVLGTKKALAPLLADVTGIDQACLHNKQRIEEYSVAQRMAWAADRSTTREEDVAYCLLGIFGINMPLLYGEGKRAFRRLQEEIVKSSDDHSIFAFDTNLSRETLFAHHPSVFRRRGNQVHPSYLPHSNRVTAPFFMTNAGLSMTTPLIETLSPYWFLAQLNCIELDSTNNMRRSQILLPLFGKDKRYMRARSPVSLIRKCLDAPPRPPQPPLPTVSREDSQSIPATENEAAEAEDAEERVSITTDMLRDEIQDLTTQTETTYLISYFTRVYSAYGTEMDVALKGFEGLQDPTDSAAGGFMLAFPSGTAGFTICGAWPPTALRAEISFFIPEILPTSMNGSFVPHADGIIVFRNINDDVSPARYVAVYLALRFSTDDEGKPVEDWTCNILHDRTEYKSQELDHMAAEVREDLSRARSQWRHYEQAGDTVVAARTKFPSMVMGQPCREIIMIEIVFEARSLLTDRDI